MQWARPREHLQMILLIEAGADFSLCKELRVTMSHSNEWFSYFWIEEVEE